MNDEYNDEMSYEAIVGPVGYFHSDTVDVTITTDPSSDTVDVTPTIETPEQCNNGTWRDRPPML